jgi:hypothetical protein
VPAQCQQETGGEKLPGFSNFVESRFAIALNPAADVVHSQSKEG